MNRFSFSAIFGLGLAAILWVASGFVDRGALPLLMTAIIAVVYLLGAFELWQFRQATASLDRALADHLSPLPDLGPWLGQMHASLQTPVRLRVEGERVALPGPALTPYLVGLLVMLGMLGTFLGMVSTFQGVTYALEGASDLVAIRAALAAPIKGLGLSFGTSIAGVAASAALGLLSAISRRERMAAVRLLDQAMAGVLRPFSLAYQRQQTYTALQQQAQTLPQVVSSLEAVAAGLERRNQLLNEQLLSNQTQFHQQVTQAYSGLAEAVAQSLNDSLSASARAASEGLKPVLAQAMAEVAREARVMQQQAVDVTTRQLGEVSEQLRATTGELSTAWTHALQNQASTHQGLIAGLDAALAGFSANFERQAAGLLSTVNGAMAQALAEQGASEARRHQAWSEALTATSTAVQDNWLHASTESLARHQNLLTALEDSAAALSARTDSQVQRSLDGMERLIQTAAEVPVTAAQTMARLQQELAQLTERENLALDQQRSLTSQMQSLLQAVGQGTAEQHAAVNALVSKAASVLERAGGDLAQTLNAQAERAADLVSHVNASAIELASLGESFQHGVALFGASSEKLGETLERIDEQMKQSSARSDEQLAYYVAQAREVIDLAMTSQQRIVEDLHRLERKQAASVEDPA